MISWRDGSAGARIGLVLTRLVSLSLLFVLLAAPAASLHAQPLAQSSVIVAVEPADIQVESGKQFPFSVSVSGVQDLGAFEVQLVYDAALVQVDAATLGDFPGSTDRTVIPLGPTVDRSRGRVLAGALTTGSGKGASGKGVLVEFTATALRAGSGELKLEGVRVTDTKGDVIAVSMQDGQVTFTGDVIVPTATAAPTTPTPTLPPVPPTATLIPTLPVAAATQTPTEVAATPAEATSEPEPTATATPEETLEPVETRIVRIATETAQALRTAMAEWTPTPSVTPTPEPASPTPTGSLAVEQPGAAASATPVIEQAATPAAPAPEQGGRNTLPLLVGGAAIVGVGAAAVWLIRRRTSS